MRRYHSGRRDVRRSRNSVSGNLCALRVEWLEDRRMLSCDYVAPVGCDLADLDALYAGDNGTPELNVEAIDLWLEQASDAANPLKPSAATEFVFGDVNLNGNVDSTDLGILLSNFNEAASWGGGNLNDDAVVDNLDLGLLTNQFGFVSEPAEDLSDQVETSMRQITTGLLNYESATQRFPRLADAAGQPLLSWRVAILPYIGYPELYDQFDRTAPWDSPQNLALLSQMPTVYAHPSLSGPVTNFLGASGEGTAFPLTGRRGARFGDLADGARTPLVVEADPALAVPWTMPGDLEFTADGELPGAGDPAADEFHVALANGTTLQVPTGTSPANWIEFTPFDAEQSMKEITLAMLNHESATQRFPAHAIYSDTDPSVPLLSWRVTILPYLGYNQLYDAFNLDEPWDSPNNIALLPQMPQVFVHPQVDGYRTNFLVMTGEDTIFPFSSQGLRFRDIQQDGSSRTIALVEADADQAVEWTKPDDLVFDPANPLAGLGNISNFGFHITYADNSVELLTADTSPAEFAAAVLRNDGE